MIIIFIQPHFTFNGKYSKNMNMCIATMNDDMFHDIGVQYSADVEYVTSSVEYSPYFTQTLLDAEEIELNLLLYNFDTHEALSIDKYDLNEIYDWLITEEFAPFISDDDTEITYYFKTTNLSKVLTFDGKGYLRVVFKPYTRFAYKRKEFSANVSGSTSLKIYNESSTTYKPIIKVTNSGSSTIKINDMEITNLQGGETIVIDNLTKLVQTGDGVNKFDCCNCKWVQLSPRKDNTLNLSGNFKVEVICEFPVHY